MILQYTVRRIVHALPILIGVNILTFALFFFVNTPDDIARVHLGGKYVTKEAIQDWKRIHDYHLPLFYNSEEQGTEALTETIFFKKSIKLFVFNFGISDTGRDIVQAIKERYLPSLQLAVPSFFIGFWINVVLALLLVMFRGTYLDLSGTWICVALMSISTLFFMVIGQYWLAKIFHWVPISGYADGWGAIKFLMMPILISIFASIGSTARWYRALFLEEIHKEYVRTARAKGLSSSTVLFRHVLGNALIPILTGIVAVLPLLFMGSLLMESFFSIPGLGSYTIDAIREQDFAIVRAMVFLGTVLYIVGLILTDISYVWVDKRIQLQ